MLLKHEFPRYTILDYLPRRINQICLHTPWDTLWGTLGSISKVWLSTRNFTSNTDKSHEKTDWKRGSPDWKVSFSRHRWKLYVDARISLYLALNRLQATRCSCEVRALTEDELEEIYTHATVCYCTHALKGPVSLCLWFDCSLKHHLQWWFKSMR